ncbi:MAG: hypothetical protein WC868_07000 [Bacteroidales bacterium]
MTDTLSFQAHCKPPNFEPALLVGRLETLNFELETCRLWGWGCFARATTRRSKRANRVNS